MNRFSKTGAAIFLFTDYVSYNMDFLFFGLLVVSELALTFKSNFFACVLFGVHVHVLSTCVALIVLFQASVARKAMLVKVL